MTGLLSCLVALASVGLLQLAAFAQPSAPAHIDARMMRQPAVSATQIAFVYAGDIWLVDKAGGVALRISSPRGEESFPRFSPDGSQLAFTGDYDGNEDIYIVPVAGGLPKRITHRWRAGSNVGVVSGWPEPSLCDLDGQSQEPV